MNRKVNFAIKEYNMLENTSGVVVGFSGGADSVSLLHYLNENREKFKIQVFAAHVNHMLREGESKRDEGFVKDFCKEYNIPLFVLEKDIASEAKKRKTGLEECGRAVRYDFFRECLEKTGSQKIATAHTLSDNAETLIFNIARGTGLNGLKGILPVRQNIIRPLIFVSREEVEDYCKKNNLEYVYDTSNRDTRYTRNKIRHEIIPKLKEINPDILESVRRLSKSVSEDETCLNALASEALARAKTGEHSYNLDILKGLPAAVLKRCIKKAVFLSAFIDLDAKKLDFLYNLIKFGKTSNKIQLKRDFYAIISYGDLYIKEIKKTKSYDFNVLLTDNKIILPNGKTVEKIKKFNNLEITHGLDCDKIKGNIHIRTRKEGDRFTLKNATGSKTLKRILIDKKIPAAVRGELLIFYDHDEIVFVEGLGASKNKAADKNTKNVLWISIAGGISNAQ